MNTEQYSNEVIKLTENKQFIEAYKLLLKGIDTSINKNNQKGPGIFLGFLVV